MVMVKHAEDCIIPERNGAVSLSFLLSWESYVGMYTAASAFPLGMRYYSVTLVNETMSDRERWNLSGTLRLCTPLPLECAISKRPRRCPLTCNNAIRDDSDHHILRDAIRDDASIKYQVFSPRLLHTGITRRVPHVSPPSSHWWNFVEQ